MYFNHEMDGAFVCKSRPFGILGLLAVIVAIFAATPVFLHAQSTGAPVNDGHGKLWMQLPNTIGATWTQTAQICPQDGITPCSGNSGGRSYNEWVWATDAQVLQLMSYYEPAMATNRAVGGMGYFFTAENFLSAFRPTFSFCGTYSCGAFGSGWTSTRDEYGFPIYGSVSHHNTNVSIDGSFGVYPANPDETGYRGVWLWRAIGPGVVAYDDSGTVLSPNGGTAVANVLANDWINGVGATVSSVSITQITSSHPNVTLNSATGAVSVSPVTPAGNYNLQYRICDLANTSICDDANVSILVNPFVVNALMDIGTASPSGGTAVASVLNNDTISGQRATMSNVALSLVTAPNNAGITLDLLDGSIDVASGTPLGDYSMYYQICDLTDLSNCSQAPVLITVRHYEIDAVNDYARATSKVAGTPIANILANDRFNGSIATTSKVRITQMSPNIQGIVLNVNTGSVKTTTKSSSGIYYISYKICEINAPANCDTATITLELSGRDR